MALRLPRNLNPFRPRKPKPLTAREAWEFAEPVRQRWAESDFCILCCIYAGALDGEDPAVGPLTPDGRSRLWHFDYYAAEAERFLRVQVCDGLTQKEETRIRAGGLDYPQMEFPFAAYGYREDRGREAAPVRLPEDWPDSPALLQLLAARMGAGALDEIEKYQGIRALVVPAACFVRREDAMWRATVQAPEEREAHTAMIIVEHPGSSQLDAIGVDAKAGEAEADG